MKPKEPLLAVIWSIILPGLGQIYSGRFLRGILFFVVPLIIAISVFLYLINPNIQTAPFLILFLIPCVLFSLYIIIDAYYCSKAYNVAHNLERKITSGKRIIYILGILLFSSVFNPPHLIYKGILSYIKNYVQAFKLPSSTMEPTLMKGDRIFADNTIYKNSAPQRGDIIIFKNPKDRKTDFVKRIVGLPNETIEIKDGYVLINEARLTTPEVFNKLYYYNLGDFGREAQQVKIPVNSYFVLGDNSASSFDSRYWGFVGREDIIGKVYKIYYPFSRSGPIKEYNIESRKDGVHKKVYSQGMWDETTYKNGVKEGPYKAYFVNGNLQMEVNYKNNQLDGIARFYYASGKLAEERAKKDGKDDGAWKLYDENGNLLQQDMYKDGLLLDENGQPLNGAHKHFVEYGGWLEQNYNNGKLDGITQFFDKSGKLIAEKKYVEGKMVAYRSISPDIGGPHEWTPMTEPSDGKMGNMPL